MNRQSIAAQFRDGSITSHETRVFSESIARSPASVDMRDAFTGYQGAGRYDFKIGRPCTKKGPDYGK